MLLSKGKFKTMLINMKRTLLDKVMQEQMGSISRGKKESRRILEIKSGVTEIKNAFDGLISRLDTLKNESLSLRMYQ